VKSNDSNILKGATVMKNDYFSAAFGEVLQIARRISNDVVAEVEAIFKKGIESPLTEEESNDLFRQVALTIRKRAQERGDNETARAIGEDIDKLIAKIVTKREGPTNAGTGRMSRQHTTHLIENYNGITPTHVIPRPWFHGKEIPMISGYIKTADIQLWDNNVRLDIHLGQFREKYGRKPTPQELLDIMMSNLQLPGVTDDDQFKIVELARSIANNGVKTPPIIDIDGTLLDGNRRITACNYILNSDEFDARQKKRAEYIFAWQLTPDATDEDRRSVVVSLNFEPAHKQDWPTYVKAQKVYEDWQAMLALQLRKPGPPLQAQMKKELSLKYALGPDTAVVNRYIKMVEWASEFEDYQIEEKKKDKYTVHHKASEYFDYFEELSKGTKPGGVAFCLNQDESFKKIVFDLLFEDKFKNWNLIRDLKYIYNNNEYLDELRKARGEQDTDKAQDIVEGVCARARADRAERKIVGANTRIETFIKWLEELPVKAFRDEISEINLQKLLDALMLVNKYYEGILKEKGQTTDVKTTS